MYGFTILSEIFDVVGIFNYYASVGGVLCIQTALSLLFMWACNWYYKPMIVFCVLGFLQLTTVLMEAGYAYVYDDDEGYTPLTSVQICQACYNPLAIGALTLPYVYYHHGSIFRAKWFDILITISLWLTAIQPEIVRKLLRDYSKEEIEDTLSVNLCRGCDRGVPWYARVVLFVNQTWAIAFTIIVYVMSIDFAVERDWINSYEKGITIFTIVCQSFILLLFLHYRFHGLLSNPCATRSTNTRNRSRNRKSQ